jgi:hypothetical protein
MLARFWALASMVGALFLFQAPATAAVVITDDGGGIITEFEQRYSTLKAADQLVILDGDCASACTLVLNIMPRERVCITPRVRLGFHSAAIRRNFQIEFSQAGTDMVFKAYPEVIKKLLRSKGWDGGELPGWREGKLIWLDYNDMRAFYRDCAAADFNPWRDDRQWSGLWSRFVAWLRSYV